ncbi:MAG TPA: SRPBCC family protein [Candidatus Dormibacteraeota bacterium]|nr:SRPBCC family protein [Candidatus Dormibacteraeota bacterium]
MLITTRFELAAPLDTAWAYMLDVRKIAHCLPGATLFQVIDDRTYEGKIGIKVGAIEVGYKGRVTIEDMDESKHTVRIKAQGAEARDRGGASATSTAELSANGSDTIVVMNTELAVSGLMAQFGRNGIMEEIAQRLAQRFASCVNQELKAAPPAP